MIVRSKTKVRVLILLAGLVVLIGGAATVYVVRKHHLDKYYAGRRAQGLALYQKGDYANALIQLGPCIRREDYSRDVEAIYAFAESRRRVEMPGGKHLPQAMTSLQRVLSLQPDRTDVQRELLDLYTQLGYNIEAVELADKFLIKDKNDLQALRAKARGLAARQLSDQAWTICEQFNALVPLDLEMRILSLEVLRDLGKRPQCLEIALDLIAQNPNDPAAELILSIACSFLEEFTPAQRDKLAALVKTSYPKESLKENLYAFNFSQFFALQASKRDTTDLVLVRYLVEQLDRTRLVPEALAVLQKADSRQETPWLRQLLIRRLFESGRFAEVLKRMEKMDIVGTLPTDIEFLAIRGISQARSDLKEPAAQAATTLAKIKDDRIAQAWATIIQELVLKTDGNAGNARQVIDSIRLAFEVQRNNAYLRFFYGLAYLQLGERDAAMEAFTQVISSRPHWQLPLLHLSRLKLDAGQKQSALEDASAAFDINRRNLAAASNFAIVIAANTDFATLDPKGDLYILVTDIQTEVPGEESTLPLYVQVLAKTNQLDEAKKIVNAALVAKKPVSTNTLLRLAAISRDCKLGLEEPCLAAAEKSGLTADIAFARANSLVDSGNTADALRYFQDSMKKSGADQVSWRIAWATLLEQSNDNRAAATWIALADDPALKTNQTVQRDALAATSTQNDAAFISRTIERLRAVAGEESTAWKMAKARLQLRDPSARDPQLIKTLSEIVASAPNNADARALLASAYEKSNNLTAAIEQMTAARKLQPASKVLNLELARLYMLQLDFQRARDILESIHPESLEPAQRRGAGRLIAQLGNINLAIRFLEGVQADAPAVDRLYLADLYRRHNEHEKAAAIYQSLLQKPDRIEIIMAAADFYASRGSKDQSMAALSHLKNLPISAAEKDFAMAEFSSHHGEPEQALARYQAVVQSDPTKPVGWSSLITEYLRAGRIDDAIAAAKKAVTAVPSESTKSFQNVVDSAATLKALQSQKTLVGLMAGLLEPSPEGEAAAKALPIIRDAIIAKASSEVVVDQLRPIADTAPRLVPLQMLLVQNYLLMKRNDDAALIALRSQSVSPASAQIAQNAAYAVSATQRWSQALAPAQKWRELTPENPLPADLFIAGLHMRLEDYASVLTVLRDYVAPAKSNPKDYALVNIYRAQALLMRGDDPAAADLLSPLLPTYPQIRAAWRDLSQFLPNPIAEKWIERLAAATPADEVNEQIDLAIAWHSLFAGRTRFAGTSDKKHEQAAIAILDRLATAAPDHPLVIQARAILAQKENRLGAAEQGYRRALELKPDLPISLNNLASMVCDRGDFKEGFSLAQRAVAVSPDNPAIRDTLADAALKLKDYPKAEENFKAAVKLDPTNIKWPIKLAQVYDQAGKTQELASILDQIEKMMPDARVSPEDRETVRQLRSKVPKTASR
jgi:tetratricopeptide (TPR) repeat protein